MNVIGFDSNRTDQPHRGNFRWSDLETLLRESDVISLHCPLLPETRAIINKRTLDIMKNTTILINTSRGPLLAEGDVANALNSGRIAGAAIDVISEEPPRHENPLLTAKNCLVTPHISWATKEARARLMDLAVNNVHAFLEGNPINTVA
jgi:glycerate dehydrogenase